jgi:hypothetical protein
MQRRAAAAAAAADPGAAAGVFDEMLIARLNISSAQFNLI